MGQILEAWELEEEPVKELNKKRAFFKQRAENSRVGAGIAADCG